MVGPKKQDFYLQNQHTQRKLLNFANFFIIKGNTLKSLS